MTAMEGEAGTQRVHVIEPHHPPPQVHTVWCFPSGLYRGYSLHCNHPTLRSRVELFNENHHAISIHGPRKKSMIRTERASAVVDKNSQPVDYARQRVSPSNQVRFLLLREKCLPARAITIMAEAVITVSIFSGTTGFSWERVFI